MAALSEDVDAGAKQWVGYPCLQPVPGGLAVDALGKWDINGAYAGKLWTICNCKASSAIPGYNKETCAVRRPHVVWGVARGGWERLVCGCVFTWGADCGIEGACQELGDSSKQGPANTRVTAPTEQRAVP